MLIFVTERKHALVPSKIEHGNVCQGFGFESRRGRFFAHLGKINLCDNFTNQNDCAKTNSNN